LSSQIQRVVPRRQAVGGVAERLASQDEGRRPRPGSLQAPVHQESRRTGDTLELVRGKQLDAPKLELHRPRVLAGCREKHATKQAERKRAERKRAANAPASALRS